MKVTKTYTLVLFKEMMVATVIDGGDIRAAVFDQSRMEIAEDAVTKITGVTLTDDEPDDTTTVIWKSGNSGWLLDETGNIFEYAVGTSAQPLLVAE